MRVSKLVDRDNRRQSCEVRDPALDLAIVIPAHNEAAVLGSTLESLTTITGNRAQIHVIADHCRDATTSIAAQAGVHVHVRNDRGPAGKGAALHWWLTRTRPHSSPEQIIIVMDADSRVTPDFIECIKTYFVNGTRAAQARLEPSISSTTPLELLSSLSEIVEHRVCDSLRARLGWPVRLRGTGMFFRRGLLEKYSPSLHTSVEDLELTVLLGADDEPIVYVPQIVVYDPKPIDPRGAVHQRARWLRGQFQVIRDYAAQILRLLFRGPKGWSLISAGLLKPRTFALPFKVFSVLLFLHMAFTEAGLLWRIAAAIGCASVLVDVELYLYALRYTRYPWKTFVALAASPLFFFLWLQSLALAIVHRQRWLSSRRSIADPPRQRSTQAP
jgi:cellulose synthase/poly-beta-1,6-N-acetylglucosamine synthase-like glycosyltransferase